VTLTATPTVQPPHAPSPDWPTGPLGATYNETRALDAKLDGLRELNSMARKPLLTGGQDFSDEPRRAPVFQRTRQLGHLACNDRKNVRLQVAALPKQSADRRYVSQGVDVAIGRINQERPKV
jgi:hypothetical protein